MSPIRIFCINLFPFLLGCLTFSPHLAAQTRAEKSGDSKPNVLLIIVDDLGFADLGCLGSQDMRTPHLDSLIASSLKFNRLYANCPVCSPTRASVITGCYPDRVGVPGVIRTDPANSWGNLTTFTETLPERLGALGYRTAAIGKWHLGLGEEDHPMEHGFDHFHGFLGDMMDDYYNHRRHGNNYMRKDRAEIDPEGHATDLFSQWAVDFIEASSQSEQAAQPWFLYVAYNAPHTPIQPPQEWLEKVKARQPGITETRAKLVALIEHMDAGIGRVLESLRRVQADENTLIVFTSDNGGQINVGANNGPLRDGKQSMYEGGLRIPGCIRVPGETKAASVTDAVCTTADFLPTIVELAGGRVDAPIDGISLRPLLADPNHTWPQREVYFVRREGGVRYAGLTIEGLLWGDLKLVHNLPTSQFELFDLSVDPNETTDLAQKRPSDLREMVRRMQLHIQRGGAVPWQ